ncbi:MAG: thioredoxin family protein [Planctomycetota bacterium]
MSSRPSLLVAALAALAVCSLPAQEAKVYDEAADARQQVAAALAKAKKENQRVLIQWGANWCGWCKWLAGTMKTDREVAHELLYEYQVVHVDVGQFDKHIDFAKELGANFKAIPYLTILGADGKAIVQQNTEPFEVEKDGKHGHDPKKLLAFLKEHETKPLVAETQLAAALEQAKAGTRQVFLHFGAPWCPWCHRLEDWMARPEIAAVLAKYFVDLKIDNDRMTGGKDIYEGTLAKAGQKAAGIPWFAFLDVDGNVKAHSTGPHGNLGFPYQPEETAFFGEMLAKAGVAEADVKALVDSLNQNRERQEAENAKLRAERERQKAEKEQAEQKGGEKSKKGDGL